MYTKFYKGNLKDILSLTIILLLMLAAGGFRSFPAKAFITDEAYSRNDTSTPILASLTIDRYPALGEEATLTCTISTIIDAPASTTQFELPEGARLLNGSLTWQGDLLATTPVQMKIRVVFDSPGDKSIFCRAHHVVNDNESWGDLAELYLHVSAAGSGAGFAQLSAAQGVASAIMVSPGEGQPVEGGPKTLPDLSASPRFLPEPAERAPTGSTVEGNPVVSSSTPLGDLTVTGHWYVYSRTDALVSTTLLVEIVRGDNGDHLAYCFSGNDGYYSCGPFTNPGSAGVVSVWRSWVNWVDDGILTVVNPNVGTSNAIANAYLVSTSSPVVFADGTHDIGSWAIINGNNLERPFWTASDLNAADSYLYDNGGSLAGGAVTVQWKADSTDGDYYSPGGNVHLTGTAPLSTSTGIHEYGHNVMYNVYGNWLPSNDCPSPHYINRITAITCGWVEGWADFLPMAVTNDPYYRWDDGASINLETPTWDTVNWDNGEQVEGRVAGALWDILDSNVDGDDLYSDGSILNLWHVLYNANNSTFAQFWSSWRSFGFNNSSAGPIMDLYQNTINYRLGPSNDDFAGAWFLPIPSRQTESTMNATTQAIDPSTSCGSLSPSRQSRSVWFYFSPSITSNFEFETLSSNYDTVLSIWTGSPGAFIDRGCNDDAPSSLQSLLNRPLTAGVTYYIEALSYGDSSGGNLSMTACVSPAVPGLSSPADGTYTTDNTPTLSWGTVAYGNWYQIHVARDTGFTDLVVNSFTTASSFTTSALPDGRYYWRVRSNYYESPCDSYSAWSSYRSLVVDTTPPTGSIIINSDAAFTKSENVTLALAATDATSGVYQMRFGNLGLPYGAWEAYNTSKVWVLDTTGGDGTKYVYVEYKDIAGLISSQFFDTIYLDKTAPTNPAITSSSHSLSTWSNDNTVDVSWSGASDGSGSGVNGYSFEWSSSPSTIPDAVVDTTGTTNTSPALVSGNTWYVHVRTQDNVGNWNAGAAHYGPFFIDTVTPTNPTTITSSSHSLSTWSNDNTVDVSWSGASDGGGSGVNGYSFEWSSSPSTIPDTVVDTTGTTNTSPALVSGNTWYIHVRTRDNAGNWNAGAAHYGPFFIDTVNPNNPTTITSSSHSLSTWSNDNTVDVSWSGASDGSGSGVNGYSFEWSSSPTTIPDAVVDTTGTTNTSPALVSGNTWYVHVRARDNVGNWSAGAAHYGPFFIDTVTPTNPTTITSSSHSLSTWSNDNTVDVSWSGASDGSGSGVNGYSFEWSSSPSTIPDAVVDTTGTTNTSPALVSGNTWYVHVRARDNAGNWSAGAAHYGPFFIDTVTPTNPTIVTELGGALDNTWQNGVGNPNFTWSGAADAHSSVAGYYVYWGVDPAGTSTTWMAAAAFDPPAASNPSVNYLRLQTKDGAGNTAAWVTLFSFRYDAEAPTNPTTITSSSHSLSTWSNDNTVDVSWSGASDGSGSGVNGYSFEWSSSPATIPDAVVDTTGTTNTSPALAAGNSWYVHIRARDNAGNWSPSAIHYGPFFIDASAPTGSLVINGGALYTTNPSVSLTLTAADAGSGLDQMQLTVNGTTSPWEAYTGTMLVALSGGDGNQTISVQYKDKVGNTSPTYSASIFLDRVAPETTVIPLPALMHTVITLSWSAVDPPPGSGVATYDVQYRAGVDGVWTDWLIGTTLTSANFGLINPIPLQQGQTYYFRVRAHDQAGNVEAYTAGDGDTFTVIYFYQSFLPLLVK